MEAQNPNAIVAALLEPLPILTQKGNDLADPKVVELLVRGYVDQCLAAFDEVMEGNLDLDNASEGIYRQASALNAVFLGTSGFTTVIAHPWNSPDQLGAFLRDTMDFDFPPEECVRAALVHLATHVMQAIQRSDTPWEGQVDLLVGEVRDLLLGQLPPSYDAGQEP
ncbi:hypothetical protein [Azospirillum sp. SYSU D00513]|uniref:hypothetical protein n=1 Tax=Azospirillum sp. SYSU D00513 TaxID=2812561 RepID=UPI001A962BD2|nr:hypothetical protein [Azospirillum sp. SYSU D00513]